MGSGGRGSAWKYRRLRWCYGVDFVDDKLNSRSTVAIQAVLMVIHTLWYRPMCDMRDYCVAIDHILSHT